MLQELEKLLQSLEGGWVHVFWSGVIWEVFIKVVLCELHLEK